MSRSVVSKKLLFLLCCLEIGGLVSCSGGLYQKRTEHEGESSVLNYEYTNAYYEKKVQERHFELTISVEEPMVITLPDTEYDKLHRFAHASGSAIVRIRVNPEGYVEGLSFVKHAGSGFDEYVKKIVRAGRFQPVLHQEKPQECDFILSVTIRD